MDFLPLLIDSGMVFLDSLFRVFDGTQIVAFSWVVGVVASCLNKFESFNFDIVYETIFLSHLVDSKAFFIEVHDLLIQIVFVDYLTILSHAQF